MTRTGEEIVSYFYTLINGSIIKSTINGSVYKSETRPVNSIKEDAVIIFSSGLDDQIQTGFVHVNIYVPDINNGNTAVPNIARLRTIETTANTFIQGLKAGEFRIKLASTIQSFKDEDIPNQHFVNVKLYFELVTF